MNGAKGLDDVLMIHGQVRIRSFHRAPPGIGERRVPRRGGGTGSVGGGGTLAEVRAETAAAITQFAQDAPGHSGRGLLVRTPPGSGKSHAYGTGIGAPGVVARVVVGTKKLAREQAAKFGLVLIEERNERNCDRVKVVRRLGSEGHDVQRLACGSTARPRCPFRRGCAYFAQFEGDGHRVGTTEQMYSGKFLAGGNLLVVDDGDLLRAMVERFELTPLTLSLAAQRLPPGPARDLARLLWSSLIEQPEKSSLGARAWDHLHAVARQQRLDLAGLVRALPAVPIPDPEPADGVVIQVSDVERAVSGSVGRVFEALRGEIERFESGEEFNSRLRIRGDRLDVWTLREDRIDAEKPDPRRAMSILVLDATPVEALVDRLLAGHARLPDVDLSMALPEAVKVTQYATAGNGMSALRDPRQLQRVLREVKEARRLHPVSSPVREAVITYKEHRDAIVALGFEEDRVVGFGGLRGLNAIEKVERLHVVGRPFPPVEEVLYLANVVHWSEPAVSSGQVMKTRSYGGRDASIEYLDLVDTRASALLRSLREDEVVQAIHRARLYLADEQRRVDLVLHTHHPVEGLRVDELFVDGRKSLNEQRSGAALQRLRRAARAMIEDGEDLSERALARRASADPRTVRKHVAKGLGTLAEEFPGEREGHAASVPSTASALSAGDVRNAVETHREKSMIGLHNFPHASDGVGSDGPGGPGPWP